LIQRDSEQSYTEGLKDCCWGKPSTTARFRMPELRDIGCSFRIPAEISTGSEARSPRRHHEYKFQSLKAKTLAAVFLLGALAGCAGGSKSSSCTNCVSSVKPEFLYTTALNQIALFNVDTTNGTLTLPLGTNAGTFPGPNDAEGLVADPQARFLFVSDFSGSLLRVFDIDTSNGRLTEVTGSPFSA
jgi:hypothetical protein